MFSFKSIFRRHGAHDVLEREARIMIDNKHDPVDAWIFARGLDRNSDTAKEYRAAYKDKDAQQLVYACRGLKIIPTDLMQTHEQRYPMPGFLMDTAVLLRDLDGVDGKKNGALINLFIQERQKKDILGGDLIDTRDKTNAAYMEEAIRDYIQHDFVAGVQEFMRVEDVRFFINDACAFHEDRAAKKTKGHMKADKTKSIAASVWLHEKPLTEEQEEQKAAELKKQAEKQAEIKETESRRKQRATELFVKAYANCYFEEWSLHKRELAPARSRENFMARFAPGSQNGPGISSNSI